MHGPCELPNVKEFTVYAQKIDVYLKAPINFLS